MCWKSKALIPLSSNSPLQRTQSARKGAKRKSDGKNKGDCKSKSSSKERREKLENHREDPAYANPPGNRLHTVQRNMPRVIAILLDGKKIYAASSNKKWRGNLEDNQASHRHDPSSEMLGPAASHIPDIDPAYDMRFGLRLAQYTTVLGEMCFKSLYGVKCRTGDCSKRHACAAFRRGDVSTAIKAYKDCLANDGIAQGVSKPEIPRPNHMLYSRRIKNREIIDLSTLSQEEKDTAFK